ncbi:MAG: hypothetical protein ACPL3P_02915, partial [Anaerolineales bacterium]
QNRFLLLTESRIAVKSCGMYARNALPTNLITPQRDRSCGRFHDYSQNHPKVAFSKQPSFLSKELQQPKLFHDFQKREDEDD